MQQCYKEPYQFITSQHCASVRFCLLHRHDASVHIATAYACCTVSVCICVCAHRNGYWSVDLIYGDRITGASYKT